MSMNNKLKEAAVKERLRCIKCLDQVITDLEEDVKEAELVEKQRHIAQVKVNLAKAIVAFAKQKILKL